MDAAGNSTVNSCHVEFGCLAILNGRKIKIFVDGNDKAVAASTALNAAHMFEVAASGAFPFLTSTIITVVTVTVIET